MTRLVIAAFLVLAGSHAASAKTFLDNFEVQYKASCGSGTPVFPIIFRRGQDIFLTSKRLGSSSGSRWVANQTIARSEPGVVNRGKGEGTNTSEVTEMTLVLRQDRPDGPLVFRITKTGPSTCEVTAIGNSCRFYDCTIE